MQSQIKVLLSRVSPNAPLPCRCPQFVTVVKEAGKVAVMREKKKHTARVIVRPTGCLSRVSTSGQGAVYGV